MKVFCSQEKLDYAVNIVNKAINPNNTLPVLNNILIKAEGKALYFSSTNLEISISCSIEADVRAEGAITVPSKLITGYLAFLQDKEVELELIDETTLKLSSKSSNTKIKCINSDEFPLLPKVENAQNFKVKVNDLLGGITETIFATSKNTNRPILTGVQFKLHDKELVLAATDSYRLAERKIELEDKIEEEKIYIIPSRTLLELSKILAKSESKDVEIEAGKNQILFKVDKVELISRLVEGKFPDYKKIIPTGNKTDIELSVPELSLALKRVNLFAKENNNGVKIEVLKEGKMLISSDETKIGTDKSEILGKLIGEENKISLNAEYILDVLSNINSEKVSFSCNDDSTAVVIKPIQREDYFYIIMPLKN